jgi:phosphoribosylanthranilate isomerase
MIQIAGIRNLGEAQMLISLGVEWLGFPLRLDVHKPDLSENDAARVIAAVGAKAKCVLITYLAQAEPIAELMNFLGTQYVQLHGPVAVNQVQNLRKNQNLFIIKSLVVKADNRGQLARDVNELAPYVDAFITDTFDPRTGASGATGQTHDWQVSRRLVEISPRPVILAGGLNPRNVATAIATVKPAGVDAHTGVENAEGEKDPQLVKAFVDTARFSYRG